MTTLAQSTFAGVANDTLLSVVTPQVGKSWNVLTYPGTTSPTVRANGVQVRGSFSGTSARLETSAGYGVQDYRVTAQMHFVTSTIEEPKLVLQNTGTAFTGNLVYWSRNGQWVMGKYAGGGLENVYSVAAGSASFASLQGTRSVEFLCVTRAGLVYGLLKVDGTTVIPLTLLDIPYSGPSWLNGAFAVDGHNDAGSDNVTEGIYVGSVTVDTIPTGAQMLGLTRPAAGGVPAQAFSIQPQITLQDFYAVTQTSVSDTITASVVSGPGTIAGTLTAAVNTTTGIATFSNLQLSALGTYVLRYASASYGSVTQSLTVVAPTATFAASFSGSPFTDAGMAALDSGFLKIRTGPPPATTGSARTGTLLATIALEPTATFNWPVQGASVLLPTAMTTAVASGTPGYATLYASDGTTVLSDFTCGSSGQLFTSQATITSGQRVQLEFLAFRDTGGAITASTDVSGEVAIGGTIVGKAEKPRVLIDKSMPVVSGLSRTVGAPGAGRMYTDLQLAVNAAAAANDGGEIVIDAGYDYTPPGGGGLVLPPGLTGFVTIRARTMTAAVGVRMTPTQAAADNIPKVRLDNGGAAITTVSRSAYWRIVGLEVLPSASAPPATTYTFCNVQPDNSTPDGQGLSYADMPHHIVYDRCYVHGGTVQTVRAFALNGDTCAVINSWVADIHHGSADSQGVGLWMPKGPICVSNNYMEATGQGFMIGGSESDWPNVCVADVEVSYNTFAKNLAWRGVENDLKTLLEMKGGRRAWIVGNEFLNSWQTGADWKGASCTFKTVAQNNGARFAHWRCCDIVMEYNRIQYVGVGFNYHYSPEGTPSTPSSRFTFRHNLIAHLGEYPANLGGEVIRPMGFDTGPRGTMTDLTVDHITAVVRGLNTNVAFHLGDYGAAYHNGFATRGFVRCDIKNSLFAAGANYPVAGRDYAYTDDALGYYIGAGSLFHDNTFSAGITNASGPPLLSPATNNDWIVNTTNNLYPEMHFTDIAGDNYKLVAGSVYSATGAKPADDASDRGVDTVTLLATLAGGTVGAQVPTTLSLVSAPATAASGVGITPAFVVDVLDAVGVRCTTGAGATQTLSVAVTVGSAVLSGTTSVTAASGRASFAALMLTGVTTETVTLAFSSPGLAPITRTIAFTGATPGAADHLGLTAAPTSATSGIVFTTQPAGLVFDASGRLCTTGAGATENVTVAVTAGSAVLSGTTTVASVAGAFTFAGLKLTGTLSETVTLTYSGPGLSSPLSVPLQFIPVLAPPLSGGRLPVTAVDLFKPQSPQRTDLKLAISASPTIGTGGIAFGGGSSNLQCIIPVGRMKCSVLSLAVHMAAALNPATSPIVLSVQRVRAGNTVTLAQIDLVTLLTPGNYNLPITADLYDGPANGGRIVDGSAGDFLLVHIVSGIGPLITVPSFLIVAELAVKE